MSSSFPQCALSVGIVLFPEVTHLDVTGLYEVFARMPATDVYLVAATLEAIRSEHGLTLLPEHTFDTVGLLDVICVPGGRGVNGAMEDQPLLAFLQRHAPNARYVAAVSTGALVLGAAGLLRGYRATTHRLSLDLLPVFGADPVEQRIVIDRNRITGGEVTAAIDFGMVIASELHGPAVAQQIQSMMEHSAAAPGSVGSPGGAAADVAQSAVRTRQRAPSDHRIVARRAGAGFIAPAHAWCPPTCGHPTLEDFAGRVSAAEGIAIDSLEPGTTLVVSTRNSVYRLVMLLDPSLVLVKGGTLFPEATVVRLAGAIGRGSALKMGWILVGFQMEMWLGFGRVRSSSVHAISIEGLPVVPARESRDA